MNWYIVAILLDGKDPVVNILSCHELDWVEFNIEMLDDPRWSYPTRTQAVWHIDRREVPKSYCKAMTEEELITEAFIYSL